MIEWLAILLIGVVQGITEFMPVSSSAHLAIIGNLFGLADNFELYVLVNIGTLGALIFFSRRILWQIIKQVSRGSYRTLAKLVVSTLPPVSWGSSLPMFLKLSVKICILSW